MRVEFIIRAAQSSAEKSLLRKNEKEEDTIPGVPYSVQETYMAAVLLRRMLLFSCRSCAPMNSTVVEVDASQNLPRPQHVFIDLTSDHRLSLPHASIYLETICCA